MSSFYLFLKKYVTIILGGTMIILLILISFLPVFLLGLYIYKKDTEKEPKSLLLGLFASGVLSAIIVVVINVFMAILLPQFYLSNTSNKYSFSMLFILIFIEVALLEEFIKWCMTVFLGYKNKEFDQIYDIVVYAVFVALGFAAFENIFYVFEGGITTGLYRAIFSVPGHVSFGVFMGYYLGLAKIYEKRNIKKHNKYMFLSVLVPALLHTIYNFCLMTENIYFVFMFIGFIIVLYVSSILKVDKVSNEKITLK